MSTRIRPTTDQAIAGAVAGHRMAGMEPSDTDLSIARRQLDGELTAEDAVQQAIAAAVNDR